MDAEIKVPPVRTQSLKPGVGQYIATHAMLTARDFFLAYFYPSGPFNCVFPKPLPIFLCWLRLTRGSCVGPQNKIGHPVGGRFQCECPQNINRLKKQKNKKQKKNPNSNMTCGVMTCKMNNLETERSLCLALT